MRREVKVHVLRMSSLIRHGGVHLANKFAQEFLRKVTDGGSIYLRFAVIDQDDIELLNLLVVVGFEDKGEALTASVAEGKLSFVHLLLKNFGDSPGYIDNQIEEWGRSPLFAAIGKARLKIVRLLLDYGADAESRIHIYPGGWKERGEPPNEFRFKYSAQNVVEMLRNEKPELKSTADAIEKMLLQIPAIRGNSFGWPVKSTSEFELESSLELGEEFSRMVVAMRRRVSRKPLVFVRVKGPEV